MDTTRYYAAFGSEDGILYGTGDSREACERDTIAYLTDNLTLSDVEEIETGDRSIDDGISYREITRAAYDALNANPEAETHRCATGLIDVGDSEDCPLCDDPGYPGEDGETMQTYVLTSLKEDRRELQARIAVIDAQCRELQQQDKAAKDRAAAMWRQVLVTISYAWQTHGRYVANNMPLADRERLAEPTPVNVLETARRRHYAPAWMTPAQMLRAMREIESMMQHGEWWKRTGDLRPDPFPQNDDE